MGAGLLYGLSWIWPNDKREWAAYWLLLLGFWASIAAVATGFYAYSEVNLSKTVERPLTSPHMCWMVVTFLITIGLTSWAIVDKHFPRTGRRIVFDYNADGNALSRPIRYSR